MKKKWISTGLPLLEMSQGNMNTKSINQEIVPFILYNSLTDAKLEDK